MSLPTLTIQLITLSLITIQRQSQHDEVVARNEWLESYDYIIIGGGSAGCVLASRLTEDPSVSVALLEAGGASTVLTDMPLGFDNTGLNWGYSTVPQQYSAFAYKDRKINYPRGRVIGGSSTINGMFYNRGNRHYFDSWSQDNGLDDWTYDQVLPYFMRSENNTDPNIVNLNPSYHGTTGPLQVSTPENPDPILLRLTEVLNLKGFPTVDINGPTQLGTALIQKTLNKNWTRASTANNYLEYNEAYKRDNLHVIANALVTKILFNDTENTITANGVEFYKNNISYVIYERNEVILSAGAINSPQILMLSGIGPQQHLQQFDIPVVQDLPVGENLCDHIHIGLDFIAKNASDITWDNTLNLENLYEYFSQTTGPLAQQSNMFTYMNTPINDNPEWPDAVFMLYAFKTRTNNLTQTVSQFGSHPNEWREYYEPLFNELNANRLLSLVALYRPRSTGTVRLSSANPFDAPLIDPNFFSDDRDLVAAVYAIRSSLQIADSEEFRQFATLYSKPIPGCRLCVSDVPIYDCLSYLRCVAQALTATDYHPIGTCRMGSISDPKTVVDSRFRVKGVSNLRVIDASIMPIIPNANTNAATIMIAERGADFLKEERNQ